MRHGRVTLAAAAALAVAVASGSALSQGTDIKGVMHENFAGVHSILVGLITSNYASVPDEAKIIQTHAAEIMTMVPKNAEADRDQFMAYAINLKGHAQDVETISKLLMEHDQKALEEGSVLATDQLREALAAHYGGMVTTCVACHNRYRLHTVKQR